MKHLVLVYNPHPHLALGVPAGRSTRTHQLKSLTAQVWEPESDLQNTHQGDRRGLTPQGCLLTSIPTLSIDTHVYAYVCTRAHTHELLLS